MAEWWNIEDVFNGGAEQPFALVVESTRFPLMTFLCATEDAARNQAQAALGLPDVRRVAVVDASAPEARLVVEVEVGEPPSCNPTS